MESARPVLSFSEKGWFGRPCDFEPHVMLPCRANLKEAYIWSLMLCCLTGPNCKKHMCRFYASYQLRSEMLIRLAAPVAMCHSHAVRVA